METNVNYTIVGIFVISLLTAIILGIIWLSSGFSLEKNRTYLVYMSEPVHSLSQDATVEFNGVKVGKVSKIQLNHHHPELVTIYLSIKENTPVTLGTKAKLSVRLLSGVSYISLVDKGTNIMPLQKQAEEAYPVILTTPSTLLRLENALMQLNNNINQMSVSIRSLLSDENLAAFKQLLKSGKNTFELIETQTIPVTNQAITHFDEMTHNLIDASTTIKQNPAVLIRGKTPGILGPGEK